MMKTKIFANVCFCNYVRGAFFHSIFNYSMYVVLSSSNYFCFFP